MRHPVVQEDLAQITSFALPWEELRGKTVLVTGANGFLPAYMVEVMLYLNEGLPERARTRVVGLVRNRERAERRFAHYAGRPDLTLLTGDVCAPPELEGPVDFLVHAASQASPKYYGSDPVGTLEANVIGTGRLLQLAMEKKSARFLYFSSSEVYGQLPPDSIPTREEVYGYLDPLQVRSCYAESKRMGENIAVSWHHQFGVPATIVRPFHTYGPGMDLNDGRVFADFVADVVGGRDIVLNSDGSASRAFCYLADAVAGFFTVLFRGKPATSYNVGDDRSEISIGELAELLAGLFPERGLKVDRGGRSAGAGYLKSAVNRTCPDLSRVRELGWEPRTDLPRGFQRTIRSFL